MSRTKVRKQTGKNTKDLKENRNKKQTTNARVAEM